MGQKSTDKRSTKTVTYKIVDRKVKIIVAMIIRMLHIQIMETTATGKTPNAPKSVSRVNKVLSKAVGP